MVASEELLWYKYTYFYVYEFCLTMSVVYTYLAETRRLRSPKTGVPEDFEWPCECWEWNLDPLEEHLVLLTAEMSLQPQVYIFSPITHINCE